jgi:chloramphenicol O-acetyltransferase
VHHALMDGLHVGRLVQALEERLQNPAPWVGASP